MPRLRRPANIFAAATILAFAILAIVVIASENIGSKTSVTGFLPFYGPTAGNAGQVRPTRVWVVAQPDAACLVSGWRRSGGAWTSNWPTDARGDTATTIPAGATREFELRQTDALFITGTAAAVQWEW